MKLTSRITDAALALFEGTRVGNALAVLTNRYEAAQPGNPSRSWVPAFLRDARHDANSWSRWELARKIRYFERNLWLIKRLREVHTKYTVGPAGLSVIPASSDSEWNKRNLEAYHEWCEAPALDSLLPMPQLHRLIAGETHIDGEIFVLKTRRKISGRQSVPAIQLVESHRVSSPGQMFSTADSETQVDGCEIDGSGRTTGFWVRDGFEGDAWVFRSADQMLHVYDPERVGMYRAVTPYHAVLNTAQDLDDLEIFEMGRAKENSQTASIWETWSGELNPDTNRGQRYGRVQPVTGQMTQEEFQKRLEQYRQVLGSKVVAIKPGEKITENANKNPSAATQWYWMLKMAQISAAVNIPFLLVLPEIISNWNSVSVRATLDDAHLSFRSKFHVHAHAARDIYRFFTNWARYNDPRCVDAPADWNRCHVIPPRAVNVDVGRNAAAQLADYAAGITNLDDIAGATGATGDTLTYKKARGVARVKQIAAEVSKEMKVEVKPEEVMGPLADIAQKLALSEAAAETVDANADTKEEAVV